MLIRHVPFARVPFPGNVLTRDVDRLFESFFGPQSPTQSAPEAFVPALNVWEDQANVYVEAELPGFPLEALDVGVLGDELTIAGERTPAFPEGANALRRERRGGRFARTLTLGTPVNADGVTASMRDGVLTVTLPKAEEARPRKIAVQAK